MKNILVFLVKLLLHLTALILIGYFFWPMAKWYFDAKPLWGVDFYYTATLTNLLKQSLAWPQSSWNYAWFTGWPNISSQPMLQYYLVLIFTFFFDLLSAVKIWMLICLGLFFAGGYACFYALSRNRGLAIILSIAAIYSVGTYGTLMWGGSLPNHATQAFFPWVLFLIICFLKSKNIRYLLGAGLLSGLAILGHPQIAIAYIFPSSAILLIFSIGSMKLFTRIKGAVLLVILSVIVGLPLIYSSAGSLRSLLVTNSLSQASSTAARPDSQLSADIISFHRAQPKRIVTDTNLTLFIFLGGTAGLYLLFLIVKHGKKQIFPVVPYICLAGYYTLYIVVYSYGISMYHGGWYRLFWSVPLWVGLLISAFWGVFQATLEDLSGRLKSIIVPILTLVVLISGAYLLTVYSTGVKEQIVVRSNPSSAFPEILNLKTDRAGFADLSKKLVPAWLDGNQTNYRLYAGDQTFNIWWNSIYRMPLARGYLDPPNKLALGYRFWVDAALSVDQATQTDQLVGAFHYPPEAALNNTLFLLDWYAIKYFEGKRESITAFIPMPYSLENKTYISNESTLDLNQEKFSKTNNTLHYYEFKDEYVTPVLLSINTPTLGIVASEDGYNTILRALADAGLGLRQVVPLNLGQNLDKINPDLLKAADALVIYDYAYNNRNSVFTTLTSYVKQGKNLLIDSGVETKEANDRDLPEIFPLKNSQRKPLGKDWDLAFLNQDFLVDASKFDLPMFDEAEWNFSYPPGAGDLRDKSEVLITNHNRPVLINQKSGKGQVYWSGMNFPYHVIRFHNTEEIKLFTIIINKLLPVQSSPNLFPESSTVFYNSQKRAITSKGGRGILFKEQAYPGWQASLDYTGKTGHKSQSLPIYRSGPSYPGFIYVRIPDNLIEKPITMQFNYRGSLLNWFLVLLTFATAIFIIENSVLKGKLWGRFAIRLVLKMRSYVSKWWEKEDESG